jgi:hypothetical protein
VRRTRGSTNFIRAYDSGIIVLPVRTTQFVQNNAPRFMYTTKKMKNLVEILGVMSMFASVEVTYCSAVLLSDGGRIIQ